MANSTAVTQTTNIVPVQGIFEPEPTFALVNLIGPAGTVFYPNMNPVQSGLSITNSTIDSSVIGGTSPAAGYFTSIAATTGTIATSPSADTDIANKAYVDSVAQGLDIKASCLYGTVGNITLSGLGIQANGDWTSSLTAGDRILVKSQTNQAENGIYVASASGWTRSADMNTWSEVPGSFTFIEEGATLMSTGWVTTAGHTGTIGVTAMPWTQFSGAGTYVAGNGLQLVGNAFSVKANGTSLDVSSSGVQISPTWPGQTSITTLGTIATGTWHGDTIAVLYGGTGATTASGARTNLGAAASGANSDITSLAGLTGAIATPTYIDFNTGATVTSAVGRVWWDGGTTLNVGMTTNVTGVVNESLFIYIKASAAITKGDVVVQDGAVGASGVLKAKPAPIVTTNAQTILGIAAESIGLNVFGLIQTHGYLKGLNTTGSAVGETWADGDQLYYNPAYTGGLTKVKPSAPNVKLPMAEVVNVGSGSSGSLFINIGASSVLGGTDSNVQFGTLNNLDVVQYDSTAGYWKNVAASTLSVSYAATAGSAGSATTATTATNLAAGAAGSLPYQTGSGATSFLGIGTSTYILTSSGTAPQWTNPSGITVGSATSATSATTATNLAGGAAASIPYQSAAGTTAFLASAAGDSGKVLQSNGTSAPSWVTPVAYATITDDTTTNATRYPLFANATTGNLATEYVSSTKLQFNPSTGILTATGFSGSGANLTSLPAGQLSGTIPSAVLGNSTVYIGTTAIALNRSSASQSLTGVNIDGSAGSASTATTATNATNVATTDNTSSASTWYLAFLANSTGNNPVTVASTKLSFVPNTGVLTATSFSGAGTGLTGTASSLSIGGTATTATNVAGGAANRIVYNTAAGTSSFIVAPTIANTYLEWSGSAFRWSSNPLGTVTSVGLSLPAEFTISNSPVTTSGTLTGAWASQTANYVFAGPTTGSPATPAFRALVASDIPTLNQNTTGSAASLSISGQTGLLTVTGILSTNRIKTVRDAADTILELGGSYTPTGTWNWTSATATWPTFNQSTTGSAAKWTTARNLAGNSVDGSANVAFSNKFIVQGTTDAGLSGAQFLGALGTGIVKNTTTTGVLSIAVAGDFPTLNQNTTGSAGSVANAVTFTNTGGAAAGTTYNGSAARTIDYSTVGAPSATGTGASGTWGISISGNAATATSATSATNATNATNTAITDDTTTAADMYLTWVTSNTGNLPQKVTSTKLKFNPSTGILTATGGTGGGNF